MDKPEVITGKRLALYLAVTAVMATFASCGMQWAYYGNQSGLNEKVRSKLERMIDNCFNPIEGCNKPKERSESIEKEKERLMGYFLKPESQKKHNLQGIVETIGILEPTIEKATTEHQIPAEILKNIIGIECAGGLYNYSNSNPPCVGPTQLHPLMASYAGLKIRYNKDTTKILYDERLMPTKEIFATAKIIKDYNDKYGDDWAVIAYYWGEPNMMKMVKDYISKDKVANKKYREIYNNKAPALADVNGNMIKKLNISWADVRKNTYVQDHYLKNGNNEGSYLEKGLALGELAVNILKDQESYEKYGIQLREFLPFEQVFEEKQLKAGETVAKIAANHRLTLDEFLKFNRQFVNPNDARAGDSYYIPNRGYADKVDLAIR